MLDRGRQLLAMPAAFGLLRQSRSLWLLLSLILLLLALPDADDSPLPRILTSTFFGLVLLAAVYAVAGRAWQLRIALLLLAPALTVLSVSAFVPSTGLRLAADVLTMAFMVHVVGILLVRVVNAPEVSFEVLCASPSIYLLLAVAWAIGYELMFILVPDAFRGLPSDRPAVFADFLYFSLVTITTLGYGDITPTGHSVRMWAVLEAVVGVFYMAVLVARLVSLYRR